MTTTATKFGTIIEHQRIEGQITHSPFCTVFFSDNRDVTLVSEFAASQCRPRGVHVVDFHTE